MVAIFIGTLAMLLALCNLGGANATKDLLSSSISASDTWSFYQAKTVRQTSYKIAAAELLAEVESIGSLTPEAKARLTALANEFKATAARYESEPTTGEGRHELLAKARALEAQRDRAGAQDPNFDLAGAALQIAVVLASVSLVSNAAVLLWLSGLLAVAGTLLMINGFTLLVALPGF